ncbi:MAG: restriction endonuclease [Clostridia bacterium]|nr:restriction endonuclease [Clostridia bacterium]
MTFKDDVICVDEKEIRKLVVHKVMGEKIKKSDIFDWVLKESGALDTKSLKDDAVVKSTIGVALADMEKTGLIVKEGSLYTATPKLNKNSKIWKGRTKFLDTIHSLGGYFFEEYTVRLLERYYTMLGYNVVTAKRTGGSEDGGIDGILEVVDQFGFEEKILIQCKNRSSSNTITTKEVREFYGCVCAMGGTRGIYSTTTRFHCEAEELLHSIHNCVGIDGDAIFRIAKKTGYGIKTVNGEDIIDTLVIRPL